jgi:CheY-like chemotaxis protein
LRDVILMDLRMPGMGGVTKLRVRDRASAVATAYKRGLIS